MSNLTPDSVRDDLKRVMGGDGPGTSEDRRAYMLLMMIGILQDRLNNLVVLRTIYLHKSEEEAQIPLGIYRLLKRLEQGEATVEDTYQKLEELKREYGHAFTQMGIIPTAPSMLYFNFTSGS